MAKEQPISVNQAAKLIPVSHTAVQKAIATGRLQKCVVMENGKPKILASLIRDEWIANTDGVRMEANGKNNLAERVEAEAAKGKGRRRAAAADDVPEAPSSGATPSIGYLGAGGKKNKLNDVRTVKEFYSAQTAKIEYEKLTGTVIEAKKVQDEAFKIANMVREALYNIPEQIASKLAVESDPIVIHTILTDEITRVLEELVHANAKQG